MKKKAIRYVTFSIDFLRVSEGKGTRINYMSNKWVFIHSEQELDKLLASPNVGLSENPILATASQTS